VGEGAKRTLGLWGGGTLDKDEFMDSDMGGKNVCDLTCGAANFDGTEMQKHRQALRHNDLTSNLRTKEYRRRTMYLNPIVFAGLL